MQNICNNFIVFEGIDGAGTTTQSKLLCDYLGKKSKNAIWTFEPTSSQIGSFIRENILKKKISVQPKSLFYLYMADRHEHLYSEDGIIANINKGNIVISDRYLYSTFAYQSEYVGFDFIKNSLSDFPLPQVVFFIDTPVDVALDRINSRSGAGELFEKKDILEKVRSNYIKAFSCIKSEICFQKIDGTASVSEISDIVKKKIKEIYDIF